MSMVMLTAGAQVKVSRTAVRMTMLATNTFIGNDWVLRRLFAAAARGVPLARLPELRRPRPTPVMSENAEPAQRAPRRYGSSGL
jgi:hypothetical protein